MAANHGITLGHTPGGKRVVAYPIHNRSLHQIVMEGGGKMPSRLQGIYASLAACKQAFDTYILEYHAPKPVKSRVSKNIAELSDDVAV